MDISVIDSAKTKDIEENEFINLMRLEDLDQESFKPEDWQNIVDAGMEVFRSIKGYNDKHSGVLYLMKCATDFSYSYEEESDFEYNFTQYFEEIHRKFCKGRKSDWVGTDWLTFNDYVDFLKVIKNVKDVNYYKSTLKFVLEKSKDIWGVEDNGISRIMSECELTQSQAEEILNDAKQRCDKSDFREINKRYKERNSEENDYDYFHSDENWDSFAPFDR